MKLSAAIFLRKKDIRRYFSTFYRAISRDSSLLIFIARINITIKIARQLLFLKRRYFSFPKA